MTGINLLRQQSIDMTELARLTARPALWQPGEPLFWNDPHISQQMLAAHLNPEWDAASRRPETIQQSVNWLHAHLPIPASAQVIDLGCGPGLYTSRMREKGWTVTGMDYSQRSLEYARQAAESSGQNIEYIYQDYLTLDHQERHDAAFLIYYDIGVFGDEKRDLLLGNVRRALKPGGYFVFDVMTEKYPKDLGREWAVKQSGFWRPDPHLVLSETFDFPEASSWVRQYVVVEQSGAATVYRTWDRGYNPDTLRPVLERAGFQLIDCYQDLTGKPFTADSTTLAAVARRV